MVPKPNHEMRLDPLLHEATPLSLSVLRRLDPLIQEILTTAPDVTLYQIDSENAPWSQKDVQGSFFVVKRNAALRFQFIILNRHNLGNFVEDILEMCEYDVKPPFLMYQNKEKVVRGICFSEPQICKDVCSVLNRILIAYGNASPNLKLSPTKSEPEKLEVDPTSDFRDGPPISSDAKSELSSDDSLFDSLFNFMFDQLTPRGTTPIVEQQKLHQEPQQLSLPTTQPFVLPNPPPPTSALVQNYLENLVTQSNFAYKTPDSSIFAPLCSSPPPLYSNHSIVPYFTTCAQYSAPLLAAFPPPNPSCLPNRSSDPSQIKKPTNATTITKEEVREALTRLVMNDSFVEMVYCEIFRAHHI